MDLTVVTYVIYLVIAVALTVWVAHTLSKAGVVFLADVFHDNEKLADAVNHLLVVGFYLVNLGFVALWLKTGQNVPDARSVFTELSVKIGTVLLVLGGLHLCNVYVLNRIRRRAITPAGPQFPPLPPVAPSGWTQPQPYPVMPPTGGPNPPAMA
jgi:hypothetical protein